MLTRISDIVERLFLFINQLPPDEKSAKSHLIIESKLSLARLAKLLIQYKNLTADATPATIEAFKSFLSARWQCIRGTDAIYMHNPLTPINQACIQLARELSDITHLPIYDFLMPSLKSATIKTSRGTLADLELSEFIMGDDDKPIEVLTCLDNYRKSGHFLTIQEEGRAESERRLNPTEINRIMNHSDDAHAYYIAILTEESAERLDLCRNKLLTNALSRRINSSYEKEGDQLLTKYICSGINKNGELINLMLKYIPNFKWLEFVKEISSEDLFRIILEINQHNAAPDRLAIQKALTVKFANLTTMLLEGKMSIVDKERGARAWLLCVIHAYQYGRQNGNDYDSYSGQVVGFLSYWTGTTQYAGVYTEKDKIAASNKLIDVILSDTKLSSLKSLLTVGALSKYSGPLSTGTLGWIVQQIEKLSGCFEKDLSEKSEAVVPLKH